MEEENTSLCSVVCLLSPLAVAGSEYREDARGIALRAHVAETDGGAAHGDNNSDSDNASMDWKRQAQHKFEATTADDGS